MSASKRTVGVLGGGRWGFALAKAAQTAGHGALVCTRRDRVTPVEGIEQTSEIADLGKRAQLILLAVPSNVARAVAGVLGDVTDGSHMIVHGVRGLSDEGLLPLSEIVRQETPVRRVGALGGPVVVDDLINAQPAVIAAASRYPEVLEAVRGALASPMLRVSETHDLTGLEWSSALVGALMVALGYARAAGVSAGLLAGLMTRGMHEAMRIGVAAGAEEHTFWGVAGFGDLMAAMGDTARPEVRFGERLFSGVDAGEARRANEMRIEAVELVPRLMAFARDQRLQIPVFAALDRVLKGEADKTSILPALMAPSR
jgi:glycerol-3-phosphate dehydrogenase (NAD(P)+)